MFRKSTAEERIRFYREEWNRRDVPDFIMHTLSLREFGFDLDGSGPNCRYNQFMMAEQLEDFLKNKAPYSAYASVALYEKPSKREDWLKAELVFDIDAKDLPLKPCKCSAGEVCEKCIEEARVVAAGLADTLKNDLGLRNVNFVYSGRGFHIRVFDDSVMQLGQSERSQVINYITGATVPPQMTMNLGYSRVFRERAARAFERLDESKVTEVVKSKRVVQKIFSEREKILGIIKSGRIEDISNVEGVGLETMKKLLGQIAKLNSGLTDGKVTVDTKRILRLPSSLHTGVSMKCILVRSLDSFKLEDAVPKFMREGGA